jgi:chromate reductase
MEKLKLLAIVGSLRKESFNLQLAHAAASAVADEAELTVLQFADVPLFNQDEEYPAPPAVARVRRQVLDADGIWFFTPEYNHFFTGVLKNLVDWLSRPVSDSQPQVLAGKPAAISGITPGMAGTALSQDHLVTLLSFLNMNIMNVPRLTIPSAAKQINADGKLELTVSAPFLDKQAKAFVRFVRSRKQ